MNFTNINDPAGIKALLEQLRSSQAWQETVSTEAPPEEVPPTPSAPSRLPGEDDTDRPKATPLDPTPSVASLLSQLKSSQAWSSIPRTAGPSQARPPHHVSQSSSDPATRLPERTKPQVPVSAPATTRSLGRDARSMTFQQALPSLTQMAEDPEFVASIARVWLQMLDEQNELERQLWEERRAIHRKYEEKVKVARTKAGMIGAGLSKHEADMMNDAFRKEMQKFDVERVLIAWDGLASKQQHSLEILGVPTMFVTDSQADRDKQQRVVQVLEGIVG
ncbi:hypothetical protein BV22DRAFT_85863 [Leucogyrophana mollusca]|uniref:Uncharacterized protein n=1 Tax=Leucogyrophana mollusca TaxID=85980 RepID=A0ACB8BVZ6_9AGAM|nr:hypothetical protein BV22DRAFT_85863 [Leucogyrophana mollusca]